MKPAEIASALALQRRIASCTGRLLRLGEILALRGDVPVEQVKELRGTALFPIEGADLCGEIALRNELVEPAQYVEALEAQLADRREKRPHRLIGSILVEKGHLKQKHLDACEEELKQNLSIRRDEAKRAAAAVAAAAETEAPPLTAVDAHYVRAARTRHEDVELGEADRLRLSPDEVLWAVGLVRELQVVLDRRLSLWECLVVRGVVSLEDHMALLDRSFNAKSPVFGPWMLGGIVVELGYATAQDVANAVALTGGEALKTGRPVRRLGDVLIERRLVTPAELQEALRIQAMRRAALVTGAQRAARVLRAGWLGARAAVAAVVVLLLVLAAPSISRRVELWRAERTLRDSTAPVERRIEAARVLTADGGPDGLAAIGEAAASPATPAALRTACLRTVAGLGAAGAEDAVRAALGDPDPAVRAAGTWETRDARALRARLADAEEPVRLAAARSLALAGEVDGREALVRALDPTRPELRRLALEMRLGEDEVAAGIVGALESLSGLKLGRRPEKWTAWLALQPTADELCGRRRGPDVTARFARLLESPRLVVQFGAARALAHLGDPRGLPILLRALDPADRALRAALAEERNLDADALAPEITALRGLLAP